MNEKQDFISRWSGSPLVTAPIWSIQNSAMPQECQHFLTTVGLPSNALWFDRNNKAIMSFDSIACLRDLGETDISVRSWKAISLMGRLTILGIHADAFIVGDRRGIIFLIYSDTSVRVSLSPAWRPSTFVNQSPMCFASSLIAYKEVVRVLDREAYDFHRSAIRDAVAGFRSSLERADDGALADKDAYWYQIVDHLDVW